MKPEWLALYGGPNQIMGLPSIFATITGLALMFWNRVVVLFGKIANKIHPSGPLDKAPANPPTED